MIYRMFRCDEWWLSFFTNRFARVCDEYTYSILELDGFINQQRTRWHHFAAIQMACLNDLAIVSFPRQSYVSPVKFQLHPIAAYPKNPKLAFNHVQTTDFCDYVFSKLTVWGVPRCLKWFWDMMAWNARKKPWSHRIFRGCPPVFPMASRRLRSARRRRWRAWSCGAPSFAAKRCTSTCPLGVRWGEMDGGRTICWGTFKGMYIYIYIHTYIQLYIYTYNIYIYLCV